MREMGGGIRQSGVPSARRRVILILVGTAALAAVVILAMGAHQTVAAYCRSDYSSYCISCVSVAGSCDPQGTTCPPGEEDYICTGGGGGRSTGGNELFILVSGLSAASAGGTLLLCQIRKRSFKNRDKL